MTWRLYYTEPGGSTLSTFDSDQGSWSDAPKRGVAALVVPHDVVGREILIGEFYLHVDGNDLPQTSDLWGVIDHLTRRGVIDDHVRPSDVALDVLFSHGVKLGLNLDSDDWTRLHAQIVADADKWGSTRRERPTL